MAVKAGDLELELIDELAARVRQRLPGEPERAYAEFVRQYFHWVPAADLSGRSPLDLCGALVAHWRTAQRRPRPATRKSGSTTRRSSVTDGARRSRWSRSSRTTCRSSWIP